MNYHKIAEAFLGTSYIVLDSYSQFPASIPVSQWLPTHPFASEIALSNFVRYYLKIHCFGKQDKKGPYFVTEK